MSIFPFRTTANKAHGYVWRTKIPTHSAPSRSVPACHPELVLTHICFSSDRHIYKENISSCSSTVQRKENIAAVQIDRVAFHYNLINLPNSVSLHSVLIAYKTLFSGTACSQSTEITWNDLGFYSNISGIHFQAVTEQFLCKHYLKSIFNELTAELSPYSARGTSSLVLSFIRLFQLTKPNSLRNCFRGFLFLSFFCHYQATSSTPWVNTSSSIHSAVNFQWLLFPTSK